MPNSALNPPTAWRVNAKDGADASRRAIGLAASLPLSVRCFAPAITRLQRAVPSRVLRYLCRFVVEIYTARPTSATLKALILSGPVRSFSLTPP